MAAMAIETGFLLGNRVSLWGTSPLPTEVKEMKMRSVHNLVLIMLLSIGLAVGVFYLSPTEVYANLITTNPGFEDAGQAGDEGVDDPDGWSEWEPDSPTNLGIRATNTSRQGSASAKLWTNGSNTGNGYSQSFSASVNQVYVASAYIRSLSSDALANGTEAFIKLEFKNSGGTVISFYESNHLASSNSAWERHTVVGTAPAKTATVQINVVVWTSTGSTGGGSAYFDDADLHQVTASAFISNSNIFLNNNFSFEAGGGTATPTGWGVWGGTWVEPAATGTVRTGSYSLKAWTNGTAGDSSGCWKNFVATGGQLVELKVYAKSLAADPLAGSGVAYCKIEWYQKDGSTIAGDAANVDVSTKLTGSFDWTELKVLGVTPPASGVSTDPFFGKAVVTIANEGGTGSGVVYFDDIEVKVFGGFGQKAVSSTSNVVSSSGFNLIFDEGWGGNISSYYDYSVNTGQNHLISDAIEKHDLFDINHGQGAGPDWIAPAKNRYGKLTTVEQSPTRVVNWAFARALTEAQTNLAASGDIWDIYYTVYPDGRIFITTVFQISSQNVTVGPYWAYSQEYEGWQSSLYYDDDAERAGYLTPDADARDGALYVYESSVLDWYTTAPYPINGVADSAQDRIQIEIRGNGTTGFSANQTKTHHWMIDISEGTYDTTILGSKRSDYRTHTSGSDLTFDGATFGSLVTGINSDTYAVDGYDEGAGCWNVQVSSNKLRFTLNAGTQGVTRYKPAFFITGYTDTNLPASVEVDDLSTSADDSLVVKEQGTDYNIAFVPFSRVYKRYDTAQSYSTLYSEGFNDKNTTAGLVTDPENVVDVNTTNYGALQVKGNKDVLDVWGFNFGTRRDIATCTLFVTYYTVATDTGGDDKWAFATDLNFDGDMADAGETIIAATNTAQASDFTASGSFTPTDEGLLKRTEIRMVTSQTAGPDSTKFKTLYWKYAYLSGTYYADDITDAAAAFNSGTTDYPATTVFNNLSDWLYVGSLYKFSGILVDLYSAASATISPTFQYYNGTSWTTFTPTTEGTSGFTKDGMITFTAPANWTKYNQNGSGRYIGGSFYNESLYYVRIQRGAASITAPQIRGLATNNLIFQYMSNVTTNTEFAISGVSATLVDLLNFDAIGYFGKVKLFWTTGSELNNAGFNILRSEDGKNYVKVNPSLIEGLGTSIMGRDYTYEDTDVVNGKTYYYILEDVEKTGKVTKHGPVAAHPGRDFDGDGMTDDWEYHYGLPATVADGNVDSDDDGLTNLQEFIAGTNPLVIDSETLAVSQNSGVKVIESAGLRTVLELNTSAFKVTNKNINGVIYHVITLPEYTHGQTTDVGKAQIPTKGVLFGTLSKKPVTINVLESEKVTFTGYNLYPVPKAVLVEDPNNPDIKRLTYEFYKDTNAYSIDAFYPATLAEVDYSNYLQDQQVIKLIFHPIRFNPVKGTLEFYKRIRLEVVQEGAESTSVASTVTPKAALPLTEDNAYKIYITEDGIYRLTKSYLESRGISLAGVNPTKLKIYNKGAEVSIYVFGEEDGVFDASDYIEFYAEKVDTRYTGTNVYWLVLSDSAGLRMASSQQVEVATTTPGSFLETYRKEDNTLYWMEAKGEDHWFIDAIYGSQIYDLALSLDGVANTTSEATVKIALEGSFYSGTSFAHHLYARLNGYPIADVTWTGYNEYTITAKVSHSYLNEGANTVTLEVADDPTGYEEIIVNWVEISYWRKFAAQGDVLAFGNYTDSAYSYSISGFTTQDVAIYDVTDAKGTKRITQFTALPEGITFTVSFKDIGSKEYIVLTKDKAKLPYGVVQDEPTTLAYKSNRADYIIITHSDFYDTILPFADYRAKQGLKVKVVKLDDIYDEFNYGIADVGAIKDFLKYAYQNWVGPKPAYVLLVGDATYDYRDYSGYGFTNYVPTYLVHSLTFGETGSDNWFVCFDGNSDVIPDMLIGRFPVKTTAELQAMINRIIAYESISPDEKWTKKVLLVADNDEKIFIDTSEKLASFLSKDYIADKQYLGDTTNRPDILKQNIINSINDGRLFVNYAGHGGIGLWANERIFTWDDVKYLYNQHTLPVFTTLTCANGYFVYPRYVESLGERLVNASSGGAIASFVPSGISYPTTQAYLAEGFYGAYFNDGDAILGSMVARGKLSVFENEAGGDAINVIQTYNLFGDPALKVRIKAPQIPAVATPKVFNLEEGKVNVIFRLTDETQTTSTTTELGSVTVSVKGDDLTWQKGKKGLTKIIQAEEEKVASPSRAESSSDDKVVKNRELGIEDIQLEDKTVALAPPKWRVLSKSSPESLQVVKPSAKIDYGAIEENVSAINKDAQQLAELRTKFDEAVQAADLQKAKSILRLITKLARKIYWRTF